MVKPKTSRHEHVRHDPLPLKLIGSPSASASTSFLYRPLQLLSTWLSHIWAPFSFQRQPLFSATFFPTTGAIGVTHALSRQALWQHGFFGKGTLSRTEPTWFDRERRRRGFGAQEKSEDATQRRRAERREFKLQRARREQDVIAQQLQKESNVGQSGEISQSNTPNDDAAASLKTETPSALSGDVEDILKNDRHLPILTATSEMSYATSSTSEQPVGSLNLDNATASPFCQDPNAHRDSSTNERAIDGSLKHVSGHSTLPYVTSTTSHDTVVSPGPVDGKPLIIDQEHLQLSHEEAVFLDHGLGCMTITTISGHTEDSSHATYDPSRHFRLALHPNVENFRLNPHAISSSAVYHHFRSLGWVVRSGVKFGVDLLLYNRGPVFSHAEFAVVVVPYHESQSDRVKRSGHSRNWTNIHALNRIETQVRKTLVMVYVDMSLLDFEKIYPDDHEDGLRMYDLLSKVRVREMILSRWSPNRNRD